MELVVNNPFAFIMFTLSGIMYYQKPEVFDLGQCPAPVSQTDCYCLEAFYPLEEYPVCSTKLPEKKKKNHSSFMKTQFRFQPNGFRMGRKGMRFRRGFF